MNMGNQCAVGITADGFFRDDLFNDNNQVFGSKGDFFLHPDQSPQLGVALFVTALGMDDGSIRMQSWHYGDLIGAVRIGDELDVGIYRARSVPK